MVHLPYSTIRGDHPCVDHRIRLHSFENCKIKIILVKVAADKLENCKSEDVESILHCCDCKHYDYASNICLNEKVDFIVYFNETIKSTEHYCSLAEKGVI